MKKYVVITADTNDGDYITEQNIVSDEQIESIKRVADAIKKFEPYKVNKKGMDWTHNHNYPGGDMCREDLGELSAEDYYVGKGLVSKEDFDVFERFRPDDEYGIHTITDVKIQIVKDDIILL